MTIMILNWENILFNEQRRITMHHRPWEKQCVRLTNSTTSLIDARCPIFQSSFLNSKCSAEVSAPVQPLVRAEMGSSPSREPEKSTGWLHRSLLLSSNLGFLFCWIKGDETFAQHLHGPRPAPALCLQKPHPSPPPVRPPPLPNLQGSHVTAN